MAITLAAAAETAAINAACNAIVDLLDVGGAGHLRITLENGTTEVATCVGQATFFGAAAAGVATQNGNAVDASATGNASPVTRFQARNQANTTIWDGTVAEELADLNIDDQTAGGGVIIQAGAVVTLSNIQFAVSMAA